MPVPYEVGISLILILPNFQVWIRYYIKSTEHRVTSAEHLHMKVEKDPKDLLGEYLLFGRVG